MSGRLSLRGRLLLGAALWTTGLFGLAVVSWHVMLGYRQPPAIMHVVFNHTAAVSVVCLACLVAGLLQVRRGWSPINRLRERLTRLREGRERRLDGEYPSEVEPLVGDLNALLDQREQTVSRARAKAGDLAHGLKTPLAILAQDVDRARAAGQDDLAASISQQVTRMKRQVDYHLSQTRAAASGGTAMARASVLESAEGLRRAMLRLFAERGITIDIQVTPDVAVRVQREDLDEMLGNLIENACKWTRTRVVVSAHMADDDATITVDDDGTGLAPGMREAVLQRGVRADEAAPGTGLGLAIVRDLAELYGGSITLSDAPTHGLRAALRLPR
jgi:signal transduction histidine kinase